MKALKRIEQLEQKLKSQRVIYPFDYFYGEAEPIEVTEAEAALWEQHLKQRDNSLFLSVSEIMKVIGRV